MAKSEEPYGRSTSTTWAYRKVKIKRRPPGPASAGGEARRWFRYARWNPREPITLKVKYRGGPECWYEIEARGSKGRFVGSTALHDVLDEIYAGKPGGEQRSR